VGAIQLALDMGVLIILGDTTLMQKASSHLLCQASRDHVKLSHLFTDRIILSFQVFTLSLQIALHIGDVVVCFTKVLCGSRAGLYKTFNTAEFSLHHEYLLAQKILFLLQSIVLPFYLHYLVVLVCGVYWIALPRTITSVLCRNPQVSEIATTCWQGYISFSPCLYVLGVII